MEENKLNERIQRIIDTLTDEQKKKAEACRTLEELMESVEGWGVELPEAVLDDIAGGTKTRPKVPTIIIEP